MNASGEKIKKLETEIAASRSQKQKCNLLIDVAMELRHSNPVASLQEAKKALAIAEEINFVSGKGRSFFCMGLVYFHLADYEKSFVFLDRSFHLFREASDNWGISNALNNIGLIHLRLGDYSKALENFSSSLEIKKNSHDQFGTANVMISMAAIQRETGNLQEAKTLLNNSLEISEASKYHELTSKGLMELGIVMMMEKNFPDATEKFNQAKSFFETQNNLSGIAQCFLHLGKISSAMGDAQHAVSLYEEGKNIATKTGDKSLVTTFLSGIAGEKIKAGKTKEAIELLHKARKIAEKTQEKPILSLIAQQLSMAYEYAAQLEDAFEEYKKFISMKEEIHSVENATQLRNLMISAKMEGLVKENKLLETEKLAAVSQLNVLLASQEVKSLNAMMEGQEKERKRIAADLHDRIGSSLSAIKLHLIGFSKLNGGIPKSKNELEKVNLMFDDVVQEVRRLSHDLDSGELMMFGIVSALRGLSETIESAGIIKVNLFTTDCEKLVDHKTEIAIYRITQELISNTLRHAQANHVNIHLNRHEGHISLMVEDDGIGFNTAQLSTGIGIKNMGVRVEEMKGKIFFDSMPGKGCTVTVEIPFPMNA